MILVYAPAGAGKTRLISTLPHPLVVSAENGLLSLSDMDIDYVEGKSFQDIYDATVYAMQNGYKSIAIDSFSEICEQELKRISDANPNPSDVWKNYGDLAKDAKDILLFLRDQTEGLVVYLIAKSDREKDGDGRLVYAPSLPGKATAANLPYILDEILALVVDEKDGQIQRALLTTSNGKYIAKDRSGRLDTWEQPDLGAIINKIGGTK